MHVEPQLAYRYMCIHDRIPWYIYSPRIVLYIVMIVGQTVNEYY